jgi:hypothetical protein
MGELYVTASRRYRNGSRKRFDETGKLRVMRLRAQPAQLLTLVCMLGGMAPPPALVPDPAARALDAVSADDLHRIVETLASDEFRGRGVGDAGNRKAEAFICAELTEDALSLAGTDGSCYQPVDVYRPALGWRAHLTVTDEQGVVLADLAAGRAFYPLPETGDRTVTARLVPAGADARDNIVFADAAAPTDGAVPPILARRPGGILLVTRVLSDLRVVWPEQPSVRDASYRLMSALAAQPVPVAAISETAAEPIRRALDEGRTLTATLTPDLVATPLRIHNVLGLVEGRESRHRGEVVVVGAHLDHDGVDEAGRIYHGADDNASGTAAVLAAAAAFARAAASGERPARTVLFALWNGEEKGELGAEAFLGAIPAGRRVVANLNLDMVGRHEEVPDPQDWRFSGFPKVDPQSSANTLHVLGYSYSPSLADDLRAANEPIGLTLKEDYDEGAQNLLERSDQWPFLRRGIPALFLTTGLHPDYHTPQDEAARIDFGKLERVARLAARAAWIVAEGKPPRMKATDGHGLTRIGALSADR